MMQEIVDPKDIVREIQKIDNQVEEELSKENVNEQKVYNLRFQQLMKGIYLTQTNGFYL